METERQQYYQRLAQTLWEVIETKDLGPDMTLTFQQYAEMLRDDILNKEEKHRVAILAEFDLGRVGDFPNKEKVPKGGGKR